MIRVDMASMEVWKSKRFADNWAAFNDAVSDRPDNLLQVSSELAVRSSQGLSVGLPNVDDKVVILVPLWNVVVSFNALLQSVVSYRITYSRDRDYSDSS
jgi:hypothetical protein